jgi:hypothetical protein
LQANTYKSTAEAGKANVETQVAQNKLNLYNQLKSTPGTLESWAAGSIDPQRYPQEYRAAINEMRMAPDIEGMAAALSRHSENVSQLQKQIAAVQAEAPIRIGEATAIARANQQGLLQNAMLTDATKAYEASGKTLADRKAVASTLSDVADAAKSGNPEATRALPQLVEGLVNNVNDNRRMNPGFVADLGPRAGSLLTVLDGARQNLMTGKSLTDSQIKSIEDLAQIMDKGAEAKHSLEVSSINQSHPSVPAFKPMTFQRPTSVTNPAKPTSEAEYNALPSGSHWVDANGNVRRKP